ncbi:MAG: hypothetical protein QNL04_00205 [SAR324 cluster bacterium]|nr:hypothetical protein [SAR324 cluster bacterium]
MCRKRLWLFNYDFELALSGRPALAASAKSPWYFLNRSALWLAPLVAEGDAIYMVEGPEPTCLRAISELLGFTPEIVTLKPEFESNANSENAASLGQMYDLCYWGQPQACSVEVNSKITTALLRRELLPKSWDMDSRAIKTKNKRVHEIALELDSFKKEVGAIDFFAKDPFGVSGQNLILNPKPNEMQTLKQWGRFSESVLAEEKLEIQKEISLHFTYSEGAWAYEGITELQTSTKGVYLGSYLPKDQKFAKLSELAPILDHFLNLGFLGNLGVDLILDQKGNYRLLEVNGRNTMGRVGLNWHKLSNRLGETLFLKIPIQAPLEMSEIKFPKGLTPLSYSYCKRGWLTLLIRAKNLEEIEQIWEKFKRKNKLSNIGLNL